MCEQIPSAQPTVTECDKNEHKRTKRNRESPLVPLSWYSKACMNWRLRNCSVNIKLGQLFGFTNWQCLPRAIWRLIPVFNGCMVTDNHTLSGYAEEQEPSSKRNTNGTALLLHLVETAWQHLIRALLNSRWWCWHWCLTLCQRDHIVHECMLTVIGPQERAEQQGTIWDKSCSKVGIYKVQLR